MVTRPRGITEIATMAGCVTTLLGPWGDKIPTVPLFSRSRCYSSKTMMAWKLMFLIQGRRMRVGQGHLTMTRMTCPPRVWYELQLEILVL